MENVRHLHLIQRKIYMYKYQHRRYHHHYSLRSCLKGQWENRNFDSRTQTTANIKTLLDKRAYEFHGIRMSASPVSSAYNLIWSKNTSSIPALCIRFSSYVYFKLFRFGLNTQTKMLLRPIE